VDPIRADIKCFGCGYNLRGLERTGRCPECGTRIIEALRARRVIRYKWSALLALLLYLAALLLYAMYSGA
jgi:DNA-directed RNA polymerase subunit RPC12/RpoP